jgi:hypothetical protein
VRREHAGLGERLRERFGVALAVPVLVEKPIADRDLDVVVARVVAEPFAEPVGDSSGVRDGRRRAVQRHSLDHGLICGTTG